MSNIKSVKRLIAALIVAVVAFSAIGAGSAYVGAAAKKRLLPIYRVARGDRKISISFDCAWGTEHTDDILAALDFYGVKCTFFAVEFWVKKYPDYARKIVESGHELGTHSSTHSHMSKMSAKDIEKELKSSSESIFDATGVMPTLFRAPFGEYDDEVISTAASLGLFTVQWDVDSLDWKDLSAERIYSRVKGGVSPGSIILCHNNGLHTAESLPLIFTALIRDGYEFVPVGQLIYRENYAVAPDGEQYEREGE